MSRSEIEIPIIDGYSRIIFTIDDGLIAEIPSDKLLKELVNFPKVEQGFPHLSDPFNVNPYRFRDRDPDLENQLILRYRNNQVIGSIYSFDNQMLELSAVERATLQYCNRHGIDFFSAFYRFKVIDYCQKLLPENSANPDEISKIITAFTGLKPDFEDNNKRTYDFHEARRNSKCIQYFDRTDYSFQGRKRRFPSLDEACMYIENFTEKPSFDDDLHEVIYEQCILINKNNERAKKQRTKNRKSGDSDYRRLTQCIFCNRFHFQEPKRFLSKFCDRPECKKRNKAWLASLERLEISPKNVSLFGF
jgi:hypothetical protein